VLIAGAGRVIGRYVVTSFLIAPGWVTTAMAEETVKAYSNKCGLADHATGTTIDVNAGSYVH